MKTLHENITVSDTECAQRHRREIEMLSGRLRLLSGKDRILMKMYVEHGNSIRQIAGLLGVHEARVTRRVRNLTKRLIAAEYIDCYSARKRFSSRQLDIARDYFCRGLSVSQIAQKRERSCYYVRNIISSVQNSHRHRR